MNCNHTQSAVEEGFTLVGLVVAIFIILLLLGVAAPKVARSLRRDRDVEAVRRGNQYIRAIQLYYRKFGHYPGSIEQLEKTNNIRFLRQRYIDPISGKDDWRLIPPGQNKTTVKGFFGEPLAGLPSSGLGSAAGMQSPGIPGPGAGTSNMGTPGATAPFGATGSNGATGATGASGTTGSTGSTDATSFSGGAATPFMGVGIQHGGESIIVLNEQTTYDTWEFLYDPRIELLKRASSLLGGPPSTSSPGTTGPGGATGPSGATGSTGSIGNLPAPTSAPTTTPPQ